LADEPEIEDLFGAGREALVALLPACPDARHVIHRDLLNRNVLVAQDASRLEAVFDWGCSLAGDFLYELAWMTFWAPWYPGLAAIDVRGRFRTHYDSIGLDVLQFDERLACYELQIGLEHIAYATFTDRHADRQVVCDRTREVLQSNGPSAT
jgi:hygromycin-B 4-O-kinase